MPSTPTSRQPQRTSPKTKTCYCRQVLVNAGVQLEENESPHIITKEQSLVIRDMQKALKNDDNFPYNVDDFLAGLKALIEDSGEQNKALLPTELHGESDVGSHVRQDSLFRILLNIDCLQNNIVEMLLEQLNELACEDHTEDCHNLQLILKNLVFLPFINEPAQFTTKLLGILEVANLPTQIEILSVIPELIPDNQYAEAAQQLCQLLEESDDLAGAIVDCLNYFSLSPDVRSRVRDYIVRRLLTSTRYYRIFPILFEFLIGGCNQESIVNILLNTRNTLDKLMGSDPKNIDGVSNKALTLKKLQSLTNVNRYLFEGFVNMIGTIHTSGDHKPIDVLLLLMLHARCKNKKKIVQQIFKKRIKGNLFKVTLFECLFDKYFVKQMFNEYFESNIEICGSLLQVQDMVLCEYAQLIFKLLFTHELCSRTQRQDIIYNLILLMGVGESKNATIILNIINDLLGTPFLKDHCNQLMGLLERLDNLQLKDVKQLFEILCQLTCRPESEETGLKDEVHMLVRKQLSGFRREVKHRGIISSVIMAKNIASVAGEQSIKGDIESILDLPEGAPREAACLLELANKCTSGIPEMLGLYYDELSSMIVSCDNLDQHLLAWLFEVITNDFQNLFIVETEPQAINDLSLSGQYSLNSSIEVDQYIGVNIGELTIKDRSSQNRSITVLAPLFRLLRLLHHKQNNGDLSSIDALLGCAVIMPSYESLDGLADDQVKQVADCVFHCINWFREVISAFVTQVIKKIRTKVVARLMELIKLEELLDECMMRVPGHKLPQSYFDGFTQTNQRSPMKVDRQPPKKKLKSVPVINDSLACSSTQVQTQTKNAAKKCNVKLEINYKFREMDTDMIILLKYPLNISAAPNTQTTTLHIKQFQFILRDFISKLDLLTKRKMTNLSHLNTVDPVNLIIDCRRLIPNIHKQTKVIIEQIAELLKSVDERCDVPQLFTEDALDLKRSYALVLEFYSLIFSWLGFQHSKHHSLLKDCLRCIQSENSQSLVSTYQLISEFINNLTASIDQCLYLPSAVCVVRIMQALYSVEMMPEVQQAIVLTSERLLKKKWYNLKGKPDTGKLSFENIDFIVKAFLSDANVKSICGLVGTLQEEAPKLVSRDDYLPMLGSIDKANFHLFFRGLCTALAARIKIEVASLTHNEHLVVWRTTALTMQGLMTVVKAQNSRGNLTHFLKKSINILKVFLSHGIPILEIMLQSKPERVLEIFKIMQTSTRFLHHLCCYSKVIKDSSMMASVPQFRLTLETLVYRVKAALIANDCSQAFWMGNLKNRDLEGEDILSQSTITESMEDEELHSDGSDDDLEVLVDQNDCADDNSASDVFEMDCI